MTTITRISGNISFVISLVMAWGYGDMEASTRFLAWSGVMWAVSLQIAKDAGK